MPFFFDIKKSRNYDGIFTLATQEKVSSAVLKILADSNAAFFPPGYPKKVSRMPHNCEEFSKIPLVVKLKLAAAAKGNQSWLTKLTKHASNPSSPEAQAYFKTAGYELMCAMRHWFVHDGKTDFSIDDTFWLGLSPTLVFELVQYGLCKTALENAKENDYASDLMLDKKDGYIYTVKNRSYYLGVG